LRNLGDQLMAILQPRLSTAMDEGAKVMTEKINAQVDTIVGNGIKYNDGKYDNKYSDRHGKRRKRLNYQTGYVDLQMGRKSVTQRTITKRGEGAYMIDFLPIEIREGVMSPQLFYFHHWGEGNNPRRQLFPDTISGTAGGAQVQMATKGIEPGNKVDPKDRLPDAFAKDAKQAVAKALTK